MSEALSLPVFRLQSPTLTGLIRTCLILDVSEPSAFGDEDGEFHSYGFRIQLATLDEPLFAAGFRRKEDAADERRRLLLAMNSPDPGWAYNPFEDLALRYELAPVAQAAAKLAKADGKARYITAAEDGSFAARDVAPECADQWCMVITPEGHARLERHLEWEKARELIEQGVLDGSLTPVNPLTGRHLRLES